MRSCGRYRNVKIQDNLYIGGPSGPIFDDCITPGQTGPGFIAQNEVKIAQIAMIYSIVAEYFREKGVNWSPDQVPSFEYINEQLIRRGQGFRIRDAGNGNFEAYAPNPPASRPK